MTNIIYSSRQAVTTEQLSTLFERSGITRPVSDLPRLQKMLDNADITVSAWDGDRLVGIARAITDYAYCCYLSDLAVDGDYQKSGIGAKLVDEVRETIGELCSLILISAPGAMEYYPKLGFTLSDKAYVIPRVK
jgi:predicted N-acetyltransferase YhbS